MTIRTASIKSAATAAAFAATIAAVTSLAGHAAAADLEVRIEGLRSADGTVNVALHRQVAGAEFPGDAGVEAASLRAAAPGTVRFVFADLVPGAYAVAAFHDADGDGALATNFLGMPIEGYGFSNGALGFMGPPSFEAAAVTVGAEETVLSTTVPIAYSQAQEQAQEQESER